MNATDSRHVEADKMAAIILLYKNVVYRFKFHWNVFARGQYRPCTGSDNSLAPNRRQAIIWTLVFSYSCFFNWNTNISKFQKAPHLALSVKRDNGYILKKHLDASITFHVSEKYLSELKCSQMLLKFC